MPALSWHMMLPTVLKQSQNVAQRTCTASIKLVQGRPALLVSDDASNDGYDALTELRKGKLHKRERFYKLEL